MFLSTYGDDAIHLSTVTPLLKTRSFKENSFLRKCHIL